MGFENPRKTDVYPLSNLVGQTIYTIVDNLLNATFAFYSMAHHAEIIPIMPEFDRPIQLSDTHLLPYIIEQGKKAAEEQMPYLRRLLSSTQQTNS